MGHWSYDHRQPLGRARSLAHADAPPVRSRAMSRKAAAILASSAMALAACTGAGAQAAPVHAASALSKSACYLLFLAGSTSAINGGSHQVKRAQVGNACLDRSCWTQTTDANGRTSCAYARGAILTLARYGSAAAAKAAARNSIMKGYARIRVRHAAIAGITTNPSGAGIVAAAGRTTVLFTLGASSDTGSPPPWNVRQEIRSEAASIAGDLRRPGCPASYTRCGGG